mgnify:CR=1 FL=1
MKRKEKETLSTWVDNHKLTILEQNFGNEPQYRFQMEYDSGDCLDTYFLLLLRIIYLLTFFVSLVYVNKLNKLHLLFHQEMNIIHLCYIQQWQRVVLNT